MSYPREASTTQEKYFPALTGIRAVAAILVFLYHCVHENLQKGSLVLKEQPLFKKIFYLIIHQGQIGVTIFFVLSGVLITTRYAADICIRLPWFRRYLQNRFARIYPIYFFLTALTFAAMLARPPHEWYEWSSTANPLYKTAGIFLNLMLLRSYFPSFIFLGVPTAWTLTIEETFYIFAPFIIKGLNTGFRSFSLYIFVLLTIGLLVVASCSFIPLRDAQLFDVTFMLTSTFFGRCAEFIGGIFIGSLLSKTSIPLPEKATLWGVAGLLIGVAALAAAEQVGGDKSGPPLAIYIIINNFLLPFPIALLLWGLAQETTWLGQLLSSKAAELLGKSSYVFYLIHLGIIDTLFITYFTANWLARLIFHLTLSIILYRALEYPLHKLLRTKKPSQAVLKIQIN